MGAAALAESRGKVWGIGLQVAFLSFIHDKTKMHRCTSTPMHHQMKKDYKVLYG
jgi:hypothetical protein